MVETRKYHRLGERYGRVLGVIALIIIGSLILVGIFWWVGIGSTTQTAVAIVGNPTTVVSWDKRRGTMVLVELPASAHISGVFEVGEYSLEALWRLGAIDSKDSDIFGSSLEETLGVPLAWYLGPKNQALASFPDSLAALKQVISYPGLLAYLAGRYRTNLPFLSFIQLVIAAQSLPPDAFVRLKVGESSGLSLKELADGTQVKVIDPTQLDQLLGSALEDEQIRRESLRIVVYNTTLTPTLGARVERLLTHLGVLVIGVGNDTPALERCQLTGGKRALSGATARLIARQYDCQVQEKDEGGRADLILRIGMTYQRRFLPRTP